MPGGWRQVLWQVAGHYDHAHVANRGGVYGELPVFDKGGVMQPGLAANLSGKPEAVFTQDQWREVCVAVEGHLRDGDHEAAALAGIERLSALVAAHYPRIDGVDDIDELPNAPRIL